MIYSMTGFGRSVANLSDRKITIEIKSLNSKQLDLNARVPSYLRECEIELRSMIAKGLMRGKVDLAVNVDNTATESSITLNVPLLADYKRQIQEAAAVTSTPEPADWFAMLMRLPDVIRTEQKEQSESDIKAITDACAEAIRCVTDFRRQEGDKLHTFFKEKIENIGALLLQVEPFEAERVSKIRLRLEEELGKLNGVDYDRARLEQELIFYIEKLDVTEEKTRLRAHLNYFMETMDAEPGQGKKLGFIAQEMGREINTLGSKANAAEMQRIVVLMKDELEQIKEQVLNVL